MVRVWDLQKFMKFKNINASQGHIPYATVTKLSGLVGQFHSRLLFQIWGFVVGVPQLWGSTLEVWGWVIPEILSAPNGGETICRIRKSFKGAKMVRIRIFSNIYHRAEYGRVRTSCAAGGGEKVRCFCLSVMLLNGRACEREITIKPFETRNNFDIFG